MKPKDITDLALAPVALALDARIAELGAMNPEAIEKHVALVADSDSQSDSMRRVGLMRTVCYLVDMHGWTTEWDHRGLRLSHETHSIVLGISDSLREYLRS